MSKVAPRSSLLKPQAAGLDPIFVASNSPEEATVAAEAHPHQITLLSLLLHPRCRHRQFHLVTFYVVLASSSPERRRVVIFSSSQTMAANSFLDLIAGESPYPPMCVTSCSLPSSSDPHSHCRLSSTRLRCHRHPSSPSPITVAPLFPSLSDHPELPFMIPVPSLRSYPPSFSSGVSVSQKPPRAHASCPPLSSPSLPRRYPCHTRATEGIARALGFHFCPSPPPVAATATSSISPSTLSISISYMWVHLVSASSVSFSLFHLGPTCQPALFCLYTYESVPLVSVFFSFSFSCLAEGIFPTILFSLSPFLF